MSNQSDAADPMGYFQLVWRRSTIERIRIGDDEHMLLAMASIAQWILPRSRYTINRRVLPASGFSKPVPLLTSSGCAEKSSACKA
jgi:hypothetical protein